MTVKKKLSMAERLAQIANPTPSSEDIETIPDGARISRNADDEFVYDDYAGLTTQPSALRRDLGLDIVDDLKYKGVTVSRRQLMAGSDDDDDDDEDDDDDRDEDEKDETEDADGDSDGAPGEENDLIRDEDQSEEYETGDSQSEGEDEEGSQSDEDESDGEGSAGDVDEEERRLREEIERIELEEQAAGVAMFTRTNQDDEVAKGEHTRHQLTLLDSVMETRIRLQQSLNIVNRLPQHDVRRVFMARGGEAVTMAAAQATGACVKLLDSLMDLQQALLEQSGDAKVREFASSKAARKRPREAGAGGEQERYWKHIKLVSDEYAPYRNATLAKWHNKTTLASGGLAMSKQLKAINQGILAQVEYMLGDRDKLLARTQLKRVALRPLGKVARDGGVPDAGEEIDKRANPDNYDAEIFDDNDLYHQLLRDLISARSRFSEGTDAAEMAQTWLEVQRLRTKVKKKVDTKASKGRKIRYIVMNELVNFMFPVEKGTSDDATRTELCRSLFSAS